MLLNYEHLADALSIWPRPLWLAVYQADAWELIIRPGLQTMLALKQLHAEYIALRDDVGDVFIISECTAFAESKHAKHLPSAAPGLVRIMWGPRFAADRWELSPGMEAAMNRIAHIMSDEPEPAEK